MKESWYGDKAEFLGENIPLSEPLEGRSHEIVDTDPFLLGQLLEFSVDFRAKSYCPRDRLPWHQCFSSTVGLSGCLYYHSVFQSVHLEHHATRWISYGRLVCLTALNRG